jgi:putative FmdB family regulatory protein
MPTYDYRCDEDGDFTLVQRMKDHASGECPTCGATCRQVMLSAPRPLIEAMADAGLPGALMTSGDRMEARHKAAGQDPYKNYN